MVRSDAVGCSHPDDPVVPHGNGYRGRMLIVVPASETKAAPPPSGPPVDLDGLSFPELGPTRRRVADALIATSADLDAFERLRVRSTFAEQVVRNTRLFDVPAMPVLDVYSGPLHDGLAARRLSPEAAGRASESVVVVSPLWGLLRPGDMIPPYRLGPWVTLLGIGRVDHVWRKVLPEALTRAAGARGLIIELRSAPTQSSGMAAGLGNRTVVLRVDQGTPGNRIGDVIAKRVRGEAAHHLLESGADPTDPPALADVLGRRWPVRLDAGARFGAPWTMTLAID
jgi:cytoplasmic iron level regulating protein YaaA (DUF328/UPF0246 family)